MRQMLCRAAAGWKAPSWALGIRTQVSEPGAAGQWGPRRLGVAGAHMARRRSGCKRRPCARLPLAGLTSSTSDAESSPLGSCGQRQAPRGLGLAGA